MTPLRERIAPELREKKYCVSAFPGVTIAGADFAMDLDFWDGIPTRSDSVTRQSPMRKTAHSRGIHISRVAHCLKRQ